MRIACITIASWLSLAVSAQATQQKRFVNESWNQRCKIISFGVGRPNTDRLYFTETKAATPSSTITTSLNDKRVFHGKMEFSASKHVGVGLSVSRSLWNYSEIYLMRDPAGYMRVDTSTGKLAVTTLNVRINYHFLYARILDPYIGIGIGSRFVSQSPVYGAVGFSYKTPFSFEATLGLRILFNSLCGFYIEAGIGRSLVQGGSSFNLGKL